MLWYVIYWNFSVWDRPPKGRHVGLRDEKNQRHDLLTELYNLLILPLNFTESSRWQNVGRLSRSSCWWWHGWDLWIYSVWSMAECSNFPSHWSPHWPQSLLCPASCWGGFKNQGVENGKQDISHKGKRKTEVRALLKKAFGEIAKLNPTCTVLDHTEDLL